MPQHKPTAEQEAIISAVAQGANVMCEAYAGTAKSTTLEMAAPGVKVPALGTAFNRRTADELKKKLAQAQNFKVKTFNGLGLQAWMNANPGVVKWQDPDGRKTGRLLSQTAKERSVDLSSEQWDWCRRLVEKAMLVGIVPNDEGDFLTPDQEVHWKDLADALWIPEADHGMLVDLARDVLERDIRLARQGVTSFDDQVYCSALLGGRFPQFPCMFVDESQDLSPLNHRQLELSMRPGGQTVVVGDSRQAIYAFRGADSNSMMNLRKLRPTWSELKLTTSFRCPKIIVERQRSHAPGFNAWSGCKQGSFEQLQGGKYDGDGEGWTWADFMKLLPQTYATIAVLCRNNAPLLSFAFRLMRASVPVVMLGRDLGKGIIALSRKVSPDDSMEKDSIRSAIDDWETSERSFAAVNDQPERMAGIADRAGCLRAVLDSAGVVNAGQMRQALERLFNREVGRVTLGSIHQSKGLEWDIVLHLDPWRIPSKWAKEAASRGDNSQLEQELNLRYVAETRVRNTLVNANFEDFQP